MSWTEWITDGSIGLAGVGILCLCSVVFKLERRIARLEQLTKGA